MAVISSTTRLEYLVDQRKKLELRLESIEKDIQEDNILKQQFTDQGEEVAKKFQEMKAKGKIFLDYTGDFNVIQESLITDQLNNMLKYHEMVRQRLTSVLAAIKKEEELQ